MADLAAVTTPLPLDATDAADPASPLGWDVPDGWQVVGAGSWGGLTVAAMLRAALRAETDPDRRVRSLSAQIVAPVPPGPARLRTEPVRIGSAMSHRRVLVTDVRDRTLAHGVAVLGAPRATDIDTTAPEWRPLAPPDAPPFRDVPVVPVAPPFGPTFGPHLEFRPVRGLVASGDDDVVCWIRLTDPPGAAPYDDVTVLALVDALWPVTFARLAALRPVATVTFEAAVVGEPARLDPDEPLLHRGRLVAARDGYVVETRELWSPAGELVVSNVQTMAIVR